MSRLFAVSLAVSLVACTGRVELDEHHELGAALVVANLTVWPVYLKEAPADPGPFQTLAAAQAVGVATVREAKEASIGTVVIENRGAAPILVCAGTVVKGGNQDRQIARDFVVEAGTTVPVDAFCVEQSRWGGSTNNFIKILPTVAPKNVRNARDQEEVWDETGLARDTVSGFGVTNFGLSTFGSTSSLSDVLEFVEAPGELTESVRAHFATRDEAVGFAYAINGKPASVRVFAHPRIFREQFGAFARSMALEARMTRLETETRCTPEQIAAFVASFDRATADEIIEKVGIHNSCFRHDVRFTEEWTASK
jgi:hypothetical protein